ncbi:SRPBCC family protein [Streptomyces sp. NPDC050560]|uniref:SRPBCC family protein n=1 Tax=Streptomyces sp. NPDC050560 TaxID=3365630 RepID=UPI0037ABFC1D
MALFVVVREVGCSAGEAWARVTRWERHGDVVPLTRVTVLTPPPSGLGTAFTARTGVGRFGFDDPMEVTGWRPPEDGAPGLCRLEKRGRVVLGRADIEVLATPGGARVVWREELSLRALPRAFDPLLRTAGRAVFGRAVDLLLAPRP